MTLRVYQTEPKRAALLVRIVASGEDWFVPDRTILHASDRGYGHEMPPDRGEILGAGHKAKVVRVRVGRDGELVHHVRGPSPPRDASCQLHLDEERRALDVRAHAVAHALAASVVARKGELNGFPVTTGGGQVRARVRFRHGPAEAADLLADVNARIRAGARPVAEWLPRADADRRVLPGTPLPPEDVVRVVGYGAEWLACDAPVPKDLAEAGGARYLGEPRSGKEGVGLVLRIR